MLVGLAGICRDIRIAAAVVMTSREQFHPWLRIPVIVNGQSTRS